MEYRSATLSLFFTTMRKLPPLNALKAFEAAARLCSFTRAASELHVTHGAISKHVDLLEQRLDVRLFRRTPGGVVPTDVCRAYQVEVTEAFDRIAAATARLAKHALPDTLDINAPPTFTIQWLVPRLSKFQMANPALEIRLNTRREEVAAALGTADVVIRRGPDVWRYAHRRKFLEESITPVCAPELLRRNAIARPSDLGREVWLHVDARPSDWDAWLDAAGVAGLAPQRALRFDHSLLALEAASDGMGVAMGALSMIDREIGSGALAMPFPRWVAATPGYYAICSKARANDPRIVQFLAWLEAAGTESRRLRRPRAAARTTDGG